MISIQDPDFYSASKVPENREQYGSTEINYTYSNKVVRISIASKKFQIKNIRSSVIF